MGLWPPPHLRLGQRGRQAWGLLSEESAPVALLRVWLEGGVCLGEVGAARCPALAHGLVLHHTKAAPRTLLLLKLPLLV